MFSSLDVKAEADAEVSPRSINLTMNLLLEISPRSASILARNSLLSDSPVTVDFCIFENTPITYTNQLRTDVLVWPVVATAFIVVATT